MLASVLKLNLAVEAMKAAIMIVAQVAILVVAQAAKLYAVLATIITTRILQQTFAQHSNHAAPTLRSPNGAYGSRSVLLIINAQSV